MIDRTLPYYKWFWQDWRANRKIQRMSYIERGLYRELLDECWVEGSIPNDLKELADICGCPDEVMADAWQVLSSCFVLSDGVLVNEKLHSLRTEKDGERLKKAENGKKGGIAKAIGKQVPSNCHIEDKIKEDKRKEEHIQPEGFDLFWNSYDKKVGKPNALKQWQKIKPDAELIITIVHKAKEDKKAKPDNKYRKDPERWLKGQHWLDEVIVEQATKAKELPLGTEQQIEQAYRVECGKDPALARFGSYFEMRNYIVQEREKRALHG
jgi:uncharacterized protein YdaU (DUF1376 family)